MGTSTTEPRKTQKRRSVANIHHFDVIQSIRSIHQVAGLCGMCLTECQITFDMSAKFQKSEKSKQIIN